MTYQRICVSLMLEKKTVHSSCNITRTELSNLFLYHNHNAYTRIHISYICFVTKHINHLFAGQKQLLGMWITKNGKNHCTIYV